MISLTSGKQAKSKGYPLSTAYYAFMAPAISLVDMFKPGPPDFMVVRA